MDSFLIPVAQAASAINDAKPITTVLTGVLNFLLSVVGIIGILGVGISGLIYMTAGGDTKRVRLAKGILIGSIVGIVIALGALVFLTQVSSFFS